MRQRTSDTERCRSGASYGAALLAAVSAGTFENVSEACDKCLKIVSHIEPNPKNIELYKDHYQVYKSLYPSLKNSFKEISSVVEKHYEH